MRPQITANGELPDGARLVALRFLAIPDDDDQSARAETTSSTNATNE
jgi:hypothetical protein